MSLNGHWVIKEKEHPDPAENAAKTCPYFKKITGLASYSADGQCQAWAGETGRFCTAKDMREYCKDDYRQCPLYQTVSGGGVWEPQKDDAWAWPGL